MKANNYDTYLFFQNMKIGMYSFQRYVYQSNRAILYDIVTYTPTITPIFPPNTPTKTIKNKQII